MPIRMLTYIDQQILVLGTFENFDQHLPRVEHRVLLEERVLAAVAGHLEFGTDSNRGILLNAFVQASQDSPEVAFEIQRKLVQRADGHTDLGHRRRLVWVLVDDASRRRFLRCFTGDAYWQCLLAML